MDFSKLVQDDLTPMWTKDIIQQLSPYPYLADFLVIATSFAAGTLLSLLLFRLLRPILHRFYRRRCPARIHAANNYQTGAVTCAPG